MGDVVWIVTTAAILWALIVVVAYGGSRCMTEGCRRRQGHMSAWCPEHEPEALEEFRRAFLGRSE